MGTQRRASHPGSCSRGLYLLQHCSEALRIPRGKLQYLQLERKPRQGKVPTLAEISVPSVKVYLLLLMAHFSETPKPL